MVSAGGQTLRPGQKVEIAGGRHDRPLALAVAACSPARACKPEAETAAARTAGPVGRGDLRTTDTLGPFAGTIQPRYKTDYGFRIFGRMVSRPVDVGSIVKRAMSSPPLDPAVQVLLVRNAEAAVASAEAQFANAHGRGGAPAAAGRAQHHAAGAVRCSGAEPRDRRGQPDARPRLAAQGRGSAFLHPAARPISTASSPPSTPSRARWSMPGRRS